MGLVLRLRVCVALGAAALLVVLGLFWPGGAKAVFPGSNGLITYEAPGSNGQVGIWTANPDGSAAKEVASEANAADTEPVFSPDGGRIAFVNGSGHIAVMDANGQNVVDLTPNDSPGGVVDGSPSFSPDGTKIAFSRVNFNLVKPEQDVWVMSSSDGSGQTNLTSGAGVDSLEPTFSPGGTKIAFVRGNPEEIWTMSATGSNPAQLSSTPFDASDPSWSPDGSKLVFSFEGVDLYLIDSNGSNQKQLTNTAGVDEKASSWSPDGTKIVTSGQDTSTATNHLYTVNPTSGAETIVPNTAGADHPDWQAVPTEHTLSVTKSGSGSGTVRSSPAGIDCGSTCSAPFDDGTQVILTATTGSGSTFTGWSGGGCSGTGTCTVTMSADRTVTAVLEPPQQVTTCGVNQQVRLAIGGVGFDTSTVNTLRDTQGSPTAPGTMWTAFDASRSPNVVPPQADHLTGSGFINVKAVADNACSDLQLTQWFTKNAGKATRNMTMSVDLYDTHGNPEAAVDYVGAAPKSESICNGLNTTGNQIVEKCFEISYGSRRMLLPAPIMVRSRATVVNDAANMALSCQSSKPCVGAITLTTPRPRASAARSWTSQVLGTHRFRIRAHTKATVPVRVNRSTVEKLRRLHKLTVQLAIHLAGVPGSLSTKRRVELVTR